MLSISRISWNNLTEEVRKIVIHLVEQAGVVLFEIEDERNAKWIIRNFSIRQDQLRFLMYTLISSSKLSGQVI